MQPTTRSPQPLNSRGAAELAVSLAKSRPALFLDFDGTISEIAPDPGDAVLSDPLRARLGRLAERMPVTIVSGRELDDVQRRVGLEGITYAGSHGLEIRTARGTLSFGEEFRPALARATAALERVVTPEPGVLIERKRFGTTIHLRRADPGVKDHVRRGVVAIAAGEPTLTMLEGKEVLELRPGIEWDKGRAVLHLLRSEGWDDRTPLYIGDDSTDEDAFEALADRGITIQVGDRGHPTLAAWRLPDVDAVDRLLERLLIAVEGGAFGHGV